MPGPEAAYGENDRLNEEEHAKILGWCLDSFKEAELHRQGLTRRWRRYELLYRLFVEKRKGDWRSKVFLPIVFYVVETILPRLIAQLPEVTVKGVEEMDAPSADLMQRLLAWAGKRSKLHLELVKAYKSALKFGTGILKVYHAQDVTYRKRRVPVLEPVMATEDQPIIDPETGEQIVDLDGTPMFETAEVETGEMRETGRTEWEVEEIVRYDGPKAESVDIFNFWPNPEAESIEDASYVIQRVFRDSSYVEKMIDEGVYKLPPGVDVIGDLWTGQKDERDQIAADLDEGSSDRTRHQAELLEFWTDDSQFTVLNQTWVVRVADNPFDHGMKPYVRIVDHFQEHSFWGVGEIEPLEGLQDEMNAITNQRIDNVRLAIDQQFVYDPNNLLNEKQDLATRPGGGIRVNSRDIEPSRVIHFLQPPDVTSSAYLEVQEAERMTEKVSGVNDYTAGNDSGAGQVNQTATGASIIAETGNTRFAAKVEIAELTGLNTLAEMYGSILQQFWDEERVIRVAGENGADAWVPITAESLQGGFDYEIEAQSSAVTESVRKEQSMSLFQLAIQAAYPDGSPVFKLDKIAQDVLKSWRITNPSEYVNPAPLPPPPMPAAPGMMPEEAAAQGQPALQAVPPA